MTLRVYKLDENMICISSDHNRVLINEQMLDDGRTLDILPGAAPDNLELLATIIPAIEEGDLVKGGDITNPSRGMVVERVSSGRIYCFMDSRDVVDDGVETRAWYSPGLSWKRDWLPDDVYKVLKTGE